MCSGDSIKFIVVKKKLLISQFCVSARERLLSLYPGMSFAYLKRAKSAAEIFVDRVIVMRVEGR